MPRYEYENVFTGQRVELVRPVEDRDLPVRAGVEGVWRRVLQAPPVRHEGIFG